MAKVKARHGTDAATYLGFNTLNYSQIKFSAKVNINGWSGCKYIGEWSAQTDKPNGRGIQIGSSGYIQIGYRKDGAYVAGPDIEIYRNGLF